MTPQLARAIFGGLRKKKEKKVKERKKESTRIPNTLFLCGQYGNRAYFTVRPRWREVEPCAKGSLKSQKGTAFICHK